MLEVFLEHKLLSGITLALLLLSIVCQIMIGVIYQKMIKEADNMSATGNKLLKQFKLKFTNCYQLNDGVSNIPVFVDKFLGKIAFLKISLSSWQHLSGQLMLLAVAGAGIGACREIINGETVGKVLPFYITSFLGLYVYFSVSGLVDIAGKKERLKTNLVDYLENHMVKKLRQSEIDRAELYEKDFRAEINEVKEKQEIVKEESVKKEAPIFFTKQEELELEELLKEFLA